MPTAAAVTLRAIKPNLPESPTAHLLPVSPAKTRAAKEP